MTEQPHQSNAPRDTDDELRESGEVIRNEPTETGNAELSDDIGYSPDQEQVEPPAVRGSEPELRELP
jgi:hypothetical protein